MKTVVPYFRPDIREAEIDEVVASLRSGWLTTGPRVKRFEEEFAAAVGAPHAVAVNSATAALHLAVEALGLKAGEAVLVPTMTFAATAEVVRYLGAHPVLVDCDPVTTEHGPRRRRAKARGAAVGEARRADPGRRDAVGIIPVHVGGLMMDVDARPGLRPRERTVGRRGRGARVSRRPGGRTRTSPWQRCGENTSAISCFSFYANKTITTGEGGMATTDDAELAHRMRLMSLHGLSHDAWGRYCRRRQVGLPDPRARASSTT